MTTIVETGSASAVAEQAEQTEQQANPAEQAPTRLSWRQRIERLFRFAVPVATCLVVAGVVLRFVATSQLWLDETLSVNISRLAVGQIPDALRHDGAPPLYYFLLHFWMEAFGQGDFAVRALSGVISVATLPLAWLAGKRLGGRPMAWASLLLLASSPFAINYATTTRMYSLMIFWSMLGFLLLWRALEQPTRVRLMALGAVTAAILYTHYWGIYLVAVTGAWLLVRSGRWRRVSPKAAAPTATAALPVAAATDTAAAVATETAAAEVATDTAAAEEATDMPGGQDVADQVDAARAACWSCFLAMLLGSLMFLPWLPSFVFQTLHTGTPWSNAAGLGDILTVLNQYAGGGPWGAALVLTLFALVLLGVFGQSIDRHEVLIRLKARREAHPIAVVFIGTLLVAVVGGTIAQAAFVGRYTAVVFPLFVLLAALGTTVFADRRTMALVLLWTSCAGLIVAGGAQVSPRTQAGRVASIINTYAGPNDVVVYCPDQLGPAASRLITVPVQQFTFPRADPPQRIDWVNYEHAISQANVQEFADNMLNLAAGHDLWFVENPNYSGTENKCSALMEWFSAKRGNSQLWVSDNTNISLENEALYRFPA
ncbi:MAG TPA: glycosyltransferase family 39 protein [Acidimicrobiales bacterium]|nr:glycosyltransferase family 39 protein [Acidimicrobiales bacterium]